ncbi:unnamed protein product [Bursaphelenchus okinawaensis]|uniref:Phosphatidic acid phosphatase type 2/haloperoxidase domain-containing protein n=1 Tax=Bursaphelenchus okinawaensis TaxID=465554 RepID=A0A811K4T9_9BILA|nr:unnamed protein product [Bursaphelenchus okinawaensis]CAG9091342.1 unnamed protein product [Bursaphelenchus okinawaensis]
MQGRDTTDIEPSLDVEANAGDLSSFVEREPLPIRRYLTDAALVVAMAGGLELFCRIYGPYERGFFCDDESIRYEYKPNTISLFTLIMFLLIPNVLMIIAVECYRMHRTRTNVETYSTYENGRPHTMKLLIRLAIFHGYYIASILVIMTLTSATKYPVGRLRPHFMDVCRPNVGYDSCNTSSEIVDYYCTSGLSAQILEARLSFFSGHSSLSVGSATFGVIYLQDRLYGLLKSRVIVPIFQTMYFCTALYIAYTRIFDNWHHWSDVLVGTLVGIVVMMIMCQYFTGLKPRFKPTPHERVFLLSHHGTANNMSTLTFTSQDPLPNFNYGTNVNNL